MHSHTYIQTHRDMHVLMHKHTYTWAYIRTNIHTHMGTHAIRHTHKRAHRHKHSHEHVQTQTHASRHAQMDTQMHERTCSDTFTYVGRHEHTERLRHTCMCLHIQSLEKPGRKKEILVTNSSRFKIKSLLGHDSSKGPLTLTLWASCLSGGC